MLGVPVTPWGQDAKVFARQTLRDNVALLDAALLHQINARVAAAGRAVFAKKAGTPVAVLAVKVDTYVLETDVHFPTDLNLLWDAARKCMALIEKYRDQFHYALPGWRKARDWRRRGELSAKVQASLLGLCDQPLDSQDWEALVYFHGMLDKHRDLVTRRLLREETVPAAEKVFSLFEPQTEWIQKGKHCPNVELGQRLLIATDQHQLIQDYAVLVDGVEVEQSVPVAETARESAPTFVALRRQHSAVESEINSPEHHGLNRCLDVGLAGYQRYVDFGVLSYNLHVIGRELLARERARAETVRRAA